MRSSSKGNNDPKSALRIAERGFIDAKTKEDVTAFILTQIILEEARNKNALLPLKL